MSTPSSAQLDPLWQHHNEQWRDPTATLSPWSAGDVDARLLKARASGAWWDTLERLGVTLLITREYEHLLMALSVAGGRPRYPEAVVPEAHLPPCRR